MRKLSCFMFFLIFSTLSHSATSDMTASSCAPNGVSNVLKEKWAPKEFWAHQSTVAEGMIDYWHNGGYGEVASPMTQQDCVVQSRGDLIKRQECITYIQNELDFWIRCGQHAKKMCRLYGGCR